MESFKLVNNTFCPLPWIHLSSKPSGDLRVCCWATRGPTGGLLKDETGRVLNFATDTVEQTRNVPILKEIRTYLLSGKKHPECVRCWQEEAAGIKSSRLREIEQWGDLSDVIAKTEPDGSIPDDVPVLDYDLRLGNLCNLKCVTCGPTESSMWYDDHEKLHGYRMDGDRYDWPLKESFWEDFERQIPSMKHIYLIGGEPMLINAHMKFLEKCVQLGYANQITLEYSSNITNIHRKYFDVWKHFNKVIIGCSIDGIGTVNDYIRFPSKWDHIYKNLKKLDQLWTPNLDLTITTTVSILNIYHLDELIRWRLQEPFENFNKFNSNIPVLSSHPLHVPKYLSIKVLSPEAKDIVRNKLRTIYEWMDENNINQSIKNNIHDKVEGYINLMDSEDWSDMLPTFWNIANKLDHIRNISLEQYNPATYNLIKGV